MTDDGGRLAALERSQAQLESLVSCLKSDISSLKSQLHFQFTPKEEFEALRSILAFTRANCMRLELELDAVRSKFDVDAQLFQVLETFRSSESYRLIYGRPSPLVSVCITTYNRARLLVERSLPSVLAQDYPNMEVIVVGDRCTDDTEERVTRLGDPRIRFVSLMEREEYPEDPVERWMVAGAPAANLAANLAKGDVITYLDDDDEFMPDRIRKTIAFLQETGAELVWHPFLFEVDGGQWETNSAEEFRHAQVTTGAVVYLSWFKRLQWDVKSYRYREPGDWNQFRKIRYLGAKMRRYPDPLLRHYRERNQGI